jgi:hypothetical protein
MATSTSQRFSYTTTADDFTARTREVFAHEGRALCEPVQDLWHAFHLHHETLRLVKHGEDPLDEYWVEVVADLHDGAVGVSIKRVDH